MWRAFSIVIVFDIVLRTEIELVIAVSLFTVACDFITSCIACLHVNISHRLRRECDSLKSRNSQNLQQTQEGIQQFKDQIDQLKGELAEEKTKTR